jgi:hypothetical protein
MLPARPDIQPKTVSGKREKRLIVSAVGVVDKLCVGFLHVLDWPGME